MPEKENRREFIKKTATLAGVVSVVAFSGSLTSCENYVAKDSSGNTIIEIDVNSKEYRRYLTRTGAGLMKKFPDVNFGVPVIIVRIAENTYKCYSSMCTHNNCFGKESIRDSNVRPPMGTDLAARSIVCKCHGSRYDSFDDGKPYQGPAERPLTQYKCEFTPQTGILRIYF